MSLTVGERFAGHFEVTAVLGAGGMGEVYRARDTRLNRAVALKILPDAFAADPDRLARFQREAELLASLNHPNIAQIHGIEEEDGTRALVLELVEGPTLEERIADGPLSLDDALEIATQVADALEAAHEAGVVHRDLKPANVKVRDDGTVKVLDFGLAKALDPGSGTADPHASPTVATAATRMGVIVGTAAYMSPEQARGRAVDRRTDVWAFGAVLFEMLTGRRAFAGDDVTGILAEVIKTEPAWATLSVDVPPAVSGVLRRCLQKDPKDRMRDIGDVRLGLLGGFEDPARSAAPPPAADGAPTEDGRRMEALLGRSGRRGRRHCRGGGRAGCLDRAAAGAFRGVPRALHDSGRAEHGAVRGAVAGRAPSRLPGVGRGARGAAVGPFAGKRASPRAHHRGHLRLHGVLVPRQPVRGLLVRRLPPASPSRQRHGGDRVRHAAAVRREAGTTTA